MTRQTRRASLVESLANVAVGFATAVAANVAVLPWFGLPVTLNQSLGIGAIFTAISIARSFAIRRLFEALRLNGVLP